MTGWIKLHRQLIDWEWYTDSHTLHVFIHCLLKANIEPGRFRGAEIPRGSFFTSILKISAETGISIKAIRLSLNKLKKTGEISFTGASDGTMITVCNYERYQANEAPEGQAKGVARGATKGKQRASEGSNEGTTIKEYKNKEEEELKNEEENTSGEKSPALPHNSLIKIYCDWYEEKLSVKYKFSGGQDAKAIKEISQYIHGAVKKRQGREPTQEEIEHGFRGILGSFDKWDSFYQSQLKISQVNSNLPNILANIKGIKNGQNNRTITEDYTEIGRQIREAYSGH